MRLTSRTAGLSIASCIVFFIACSSDDATPGGDDGSSGNGTSGKSSSGEGGASSGDNTSGNGSSSGEGGAVDPDPPVPVGDGSLGAGCNKNEECHSGVCAVGHKCVAGLSCKASSRAGDVPGIDTCGKAEPGDESCCATLTLPKTTTRTLDKFEITSGRIRSFIDALPNKNLRKFVTDYAAANPDSELGKMLEDFPDYEKVIPATGGVDAEFPDTLLPLWLGAFPNDTMNRYDGCAVSPDGFGAATYWQEPGVLKTFNVGYGKDPDHLDGTRKYPASVLDTKPANCMPPVLLAAFCAWDGGELARMSDYYEVWGHTPVHIGDLPTQPTPKPVNWTSPWETTFLKPGEFNWRNGHGVGCDMPNWPGCDPAASEDNPPATFFSFPKGGKSSDDDSPEIGAPGRFPKDVTKIKSPDGAGWYDMGGNLLEAAWPKSKASFKPSIKTYCNTAAPSDVGDPGYCNRDQPASGAIPAEARPGTQIYPDPSNPGALVPAVALIGFSFEGHSELGEPYFANPTDDETKLGTGYPAHFQYGKVGGRCARTKK